MKVREVPTVDVKPYPGNPRNNDDAVAAVAESLREFGWRQPIVVDADMTVVAGHTRLKAAQRLGMETVPVTVASDLTPEQVAAYRLADNKVAELATWDMEALALELDGLAGFDMERFGFDLGEALGAGQVEGIDGVLEDEPPEDAPSRVLRGQIWRLGDHVLMCGDSTDVADVAALMAAAGGAADMLLTDPPYNVAVVGSTKDALTIENDSWEDEGRFQEFLSKAFAAAAENMRPGAAAYIWLASTHMPAFASAMVGAGLLWKQVLCWVKNTFVLGRQDYQWRHEPCLYGWKPGAPHHFFDSRSESTVIEDARPDPRKMTKADLVELASSLLEERSASTVLEFDKPARSAEHPTMKPVKLFAYLMRNSSRPGELVLDPFGGSGTTLVAAEQLGRRCATMELDERYASVIVERWERLTGRCAELVRDA